MTRKLLLLGLVLTVLCVIAFAVILVIRLNHQSELRKERRLTHPILTAKEAEGLMGGREKVLSLYVNERGEIFTYFDDKSMITYWVGFDPQNRQKPILIIKSPLVEQYVNSIPAVVVVREIGTSGIYAVVLK